MPRLHDRRPESEPDAIHEPLIEHPPRVESAHAGSDQPRDRTHGIVAIQSDQLRKIIAGTDRDDAEGGIGVGAQQTVCDLMDGAIPADRHHILRALPHRLRRQLLAVAGPFGPHDIHGPPLCPEGARHDGLGASGGASARSGIEDDMGMKHAADKIQSRLPRKAYRAKGWSYLARYCSSQSTANSTLQRPH